MRVQPEGILARFAQSDARATSYLCRNSKRTLDTADAVDATESITRASDNPTYGGIQPPAQGGFPGLLLCSFLWGEANQDVIVVVLLPV